MKSDMGEESERNKDERDMVRETERNGERYGMKRGGERYALMRAEGGLAPRFLQPCKLTFGKTRC